MKVNVHALAFFLPAALLFTSGCSVHIDDRESRMPLKTRSVSVNEDSAKEASVQLNIPAGELVVRGGAAKLVEGFVKYRRLRDEPEVSSSVVDGKASVKIEARHTTGGFGERGYTWDLELNEKVPTSVNINCGAGQARLDLGDISLQGLQIHMGAGQVDLDLRGKPAASYDVEISGGVGQATIHLPKGVGIRAEAHGGIGNISVTGREKQGDYWQNDLYNNSPVKIGLQVHGGIGEIKIEG